MRTLDLAVALSQIAGSLALVASVLLLFRELRETNRLTKAANTQSLVALSSPFHMGLIQDRGTAELFLRGASAFGELDDVDKARYRNLVIWWLIFHENVYYQWRQGLLDLRSYKPWAKDLREFVRNQRVEDHWASIRHLFQDDFATHLTTVIAER